jgi:hypothetical protein
MWFAGEAIILGPVRIVAGACGIAFGTLTEVRESN